MSETLRVPVRESGSDQGIRSMSLLGLRVLSDRPDKKRRSSAPGEASQVERPEDRNRLRNADRHPVRLVRRHEGGRGKGMKENRSRASRFFRYWLKHSYFAAILILLGWTLAAVADTTIPSQDVSLHTILTLAGGAVAFMGIFGGISRWVAEPAARKVLSDHLKDGVNAHYNVYVSRDEWDKKHEELLNQISGVKESVATLTAALMKVDRVK